MFLSEKAVHESLTVLGINAITLEDLELGSMTNVQAAFHRDASQRSELSQEDRARQEGVYGKTTPLPCAVPRVMCSLSVL